MNSLRSILMCLVFLLTACGGGGGGSTPPPATGGGGTGGGTGGGGGGGGGTIGQGLIGFTLDTGIGGSGGLLGSIQGFGSVFVNEQEMNTDDAVFVIEGESGSESELDEGKQVAVFGDITTLSAAEVYYRANVKGPMTSITQVDPVIGKAELMVLGQRVKISPTTVFKNSTLTTLMLDDLLEVSGGVNSNGEVVATFVEVKTTLTEYKVVGNIGNLNASTFELDDLIVDHTGAILSEFESALLAEGQLVEVKMAAASFTAPSTAVAGEIELLPGLEINEGAEAEIEGYIDTFVSITGFSVAGISIITDGATEFEDGDGSLLAANVKVEVEGAADAAGTILAEKVQFESTNAIRVEGPVSVSGANPTAGTVTTDLGVTFEIRTLTNLEDNSSLSLDPLTLADMGDGDRVEVRGFLSGTAIVAVELDREDPDSRAILRGPVTAQDEIGRTVEILGVTVIVDDVTKFEDLSGTEIAEAVFYSSLGDGLFVEARWDAFTNTGQIVDRLSLEDDD